jgi:hypothetical protein
VTMPAARRTAGLLAAAMLACALASCAGQPASVPPTQSPASSSSPDPGQPDPGQPGSGQPGPQGAVGTWMLTRSALSQMLPDLSVRAELERTRIDEVLQPRQQPLSGVDATPVVSFSSVATLRSTLAAGGLPTGTQAVLYDPEVWAYTPAAEQRDPVLAAAQAAELARSYGLKMIVAPAMNLTSVLDPGSTAPRWQTLLSLHIIGSMARVADTVELQAQSLERDPAAYATFVREAAAQAKAANPKVTVLAGLSTNPPGAAVDSQQLTAAIRASQADVDGYWLNIPGSGPRCPGCNAGQPELGATVLSDNI